MKLIKYKVKQFAEIIGGGTPSTKNTAYWEGDIPWITPNDLTSFEGVYIEKGERNITKEGLNQSSAKLLPKKTILLTSRAPVGYVAIAKNDLSTNQGFKNLICDKNLSDPEFVYYLLKINKKYLQSNSTGSTFGELSASRVKNLYFYLPEVNIQKRIASTLLKYDELIDKNHKRIQLLEEAARLLYREWFVYFRFPGHENVKIIDGIPEGWKKKSLSEIVTTQYGYTETATQDKIGPKFLRGKDINKSSYIDW
ncbi:restriction endonuclease subunit S, partial [Candidatus Woesearchaeota archaeon]|nr:restriction endonuclease subunit S [Candidatus Woesearchaeota archaeon]